ncbi:Octicosapeptide/Phox/Bem1p domain-containing protein / tetratricopeptide repeat protein [Perilla frutescens var. hirtella]|nr:Octicosapeptide/Phox/Bem1p domain-containing protein / tetratricopeptide repeat protein [Perilla frutescens var. hirtella]
MVKLHWSLILAKKEELSKWDPTDTIALFDSAEEKMKTTTVLWEKLEEHRANELKDPSSNKKDELLKRKKKQGIDAQSELKINWRFSDWKTKIFEENLGI